MIKSTGRRALGMSPNFSKPSFPISNMVFCVPGSQYAWRNMSYYYAGFLAGGGVGGGGEYKRWKSSPQNIPAAGVPSLLSEASFNPLRNKTLAKRPKQLSHLKEFLSPHPLSTSPVEKYPVLPSRSPEHRGGRVGA